MAQVPSRDERQTDYALASLIRQQGLQEKVFVAELRGQLLGCLAVTSLVDIRPLQQNFNLHVYDQLVQPEVYETALSVHGQQAAAEVAGKWPTHCGSFLFPPFPPSPSKRALHLAT